MANVYVDIDGTLLDSRLDDAFNERVAEYGIEAAMAWYNTAYCDNLELNIGLWLRLVVLKEEGHTIIVWTNRHEQKAEMTLTNIAKWGIMDLFSGFMFCDGGKCKFQLKNGIVFENDLSNEVECKEFNYIPTFVI